jgi:hypothetical protein
VYDQRTITTLDEKRVRELVFLVRRWVVGHRVEDVAGGNG